MVLLTVHKIVPNTFHRVVRYGLLRDVRHTSKLSYLVDGGEKSAFKNVIHTCLVLNSENIPYML